MTSSRSTSDPAELSGLSQLAADYDGLLCDLWGVVHNGVEAFPAAVDALVRFREGGGQVVLITNAPRPSAPIHDMLKRLRIPRAAYDDLITSGDLTRSLLAERAGQSFFHLGPERDIPVYQGTGVDPVEVAEARFVLCTGLFDDETETPDDYRELFAEMRGRDLEMICANPDLIVDRGNNRIFCAGALAAAYEELGGRVIYAGKPHLPIYDAAREMYRTDHLNGPLRILAVGDNLNTDIRGASVAALDSLFISGGIHLGEPDADADHARLFADMERPPRAVMPALRW